MKKLLYILLLVLSNYAIAQYNPNAPWMKNLKNQESGARSQESTNKNVPLAKISEAFNEYWKDKDHTVKGSGYKPFKRWEYNRQTMLLPDGTIPSAKYVYETNIAEHQKFASSSNSSNWTTTGPMTESTGQGRVNVATVDPKNPNIYYVGAPAGGLWKSVDKGTSWEPLTDHLPAIGVSGIAIDPNDSNIIYISTGDDDNNDSNGLGVFKTIDGGRTWKTDARYTPELGEYSSGSELYVNPNNSNILWQATSDGLYKTLDAGNTWTRVLEGRIQDFKLKPNNPDVLYATSFVPSGIKLFKSMDGGTTFIDKTRDIPMQLDRTVIDVTPAAPENLYVFSANVLTASTGGILYKSENAGDSFVELNRNLLDTKQSWYDWALAVSDVNPDHIAIGGIKGKVSKDGGRTFRFTRYGHADVHFLRYNNGVLFCGNDGGFITIDENDTFKDHSKGLNIGQYYKINIGDLYNGDTGVIIGGTQDNGGQILKNQAWSQWHGADGMDCAIGSGNEGLIYGLMQNGDRLFLGRNLGEYYGGSIDKPIEEDYSLWVVASDINSKDEMYVGYDALYKANIASSKFEKLHDFGATIFTVIIDDNDDNIIYALVITDANVTSYDSMLFKSTDAGKTFSVFHDDVNPIREMELSQDGSNTIWFTTKTSKGDEQLYKANTTGQTASEITLVSNDLPKSINVIKHQPYSDNLFLGTRYGLFYKNGEKPWESYDNNLPNVPIRDLEISVEDKIIVAGTYGRGIWRSPIPEANGVLCALNIPSQLDSLVQDKGVSISWEGDKKLEDYEIRYKTVNGNEWITKTIGVNNYYLNNLTLQSGVEYELKVRSTCNSSFSEFSIPIKFTWSDVKAPSVPVNLNVFDIKKTSAILTWEASTDNTQVSHYEIYNRIGNETVLLTETVGPESYLPLEGLNGSADYTLFIVALDLAGNKSEPSETLSFSTKSILMPGPPQNLLVLENTGVQATLKWEAPAGTEVVKAYEVYDSNYHLLGTTLDAQIVLDKLPSNFWFYCYVKAVGSDNSTSEKSNAVSFRFQGVNQFEPNPPTNPEVLGNVHTSVEFKWDASIAKENVEISHYDVFVQNGFDFERFGGENRKIGSSTTTQIRVTSLKPDTIYWGSIVAVSKNGFKSVPSQSFQIYLKGNPDIEAPTVPRNLRSGKVSSSSLELIWDASTDNVGVAYYEVFEQIGGRTVKVGEDRIANVIIEGLLPFSLHTYQVSATDYEGNVSELSEPITIATLHKEFPGRPYGLVASDISPNSFVATWRDTANTSQYYVSSYDGVNIKEFGPLRSANYVFENIGTPYLFWRVIAENELGRMYSSWELTSLDTREGGINIVLNGNESQQVVVVSSAYENASYNLFSLSGILIKRGVVKEGEVNVTNLKKGVYILKIDNDLKPFTKKVVIE
ncbi:fibronectin type III domain-containing protein [Tenacibaculum sp. MAR_2009_124]|uniref:fibronectin type III domain-containing protein n=1 Tax=Tenacibaculum sp. MAR_2009_124 TaxID=1250059 RepID=UPI000B8849AB|nr:fibronectin type III domain-containing protein [Tenacibaculum sp. MAR_2009_124]